MQEHRKKDSEIIQSVVKKRFGLDITVEEACAVWGQYSDARYAAGWMGVDSEDEIIFAYKYNHSARARELLDHIEKLQGELTASQQIAATDRL